MENKLITVRENKLTIMDTNLKNAISAMRSKIAEMEKEQKNYKNQRRTVRLVGERTMPAWVANENSRRGRQP